MPDPVRVLQFDFLRGLPLSRRLDLARTWWKGSRLLGRGLVCPIFCLLKPAGPHG